jgi:hypothetical protein
MFNPLLVSLTKWEKMQLLSDLMADVSEMVRELLCTEIVCVCACVRVSRVGRA